MTQDEKIKYLKELVEELEEREVQVFMWEEDAGIIESLKREIIEKIKEL